MSVDPAQANGDAIALASSPSSLDPSPKVSWGAASPGLVSLLLVLVAGCGEVTNDACVGESVVELCTERARLCGKLVAFDRCSMGRSIDCGQCTAPGDVCGGGGVGSVVAGVCDAHPPLEGVDGYILGMTRYSVTFATNGVASSSGFCCGNSIDEARASYPQFSLVVLPEQSQIVAGQIPSLYKVDGYIVKSALDPTKLEYRGAIDGAMDGTSECCAADVPAMRAAHPTKNLAYLPFFGIEGP